MEYVGGLYIPCPSYKQPKRRIYNCWLHKTIICVPYDFIMRGKYFLQVTLVHVLYITVTKVSKLVLDKPSKVINQNLFMHYSSNTYACFLSYKSRCE